MSIIKNLLGIDRSAEDRFNEAGQLALTGVGLAPIVFGMYHSFKSGQPMRVSDFGQRGMLAQVAERAARGSRASLEQRIVEDAMKGDAMYKIFEQVA